MTTLLDLALDERLESRVRAARRRASHPAAAGPATLPETEGLVSAGALRRDAISRRGLIVADVVAAGVALYFSVVLIGGDTLQPAMAAGIPLVILLGKVMALYDRDELVFHKSTLDEA